jgi:hypothetical protein
MSPSTGRAIANILFSILCGNASHSVRHLQVLGLRHSVVCSVEPQLSNAWVALDASGLLHTRSNILRHLPEDSNFALNNLFVLDRGHVASDVVDEALLGAVIKHLLPQCARCVEVLWADLG